MHIWLGLLAAITLVGYSIVGCTLTRAHDATHQHHAWFNEQRMNQATRERLGVGYQSCCDVGDHYPTRFRVVEDGSPYGQETYQYLADGKWKNIPPDIVQRKKTPDGRPVLFRSPHSGVEYCFIIDEPGI